MDIELKNQIVLLLVSRSGRKNTYESMQRLVNEVFVDKAWEPHPSHKFINNACQCGGRLWQGAHELKLDEPCPFAQQSE